MEEMKNLVIQTLETKGVLGQIRAKLRSSVFKVVDEQDQKSNLQMGCELKWENQLLYKIKDTNVGGVISELIREFMEYLKMDYSLSVFIPECSISPERLKKDEILAKLGLSIDNFSPQVPILFFIIHYFIDSIQSEPQKVYESLNRISHSDVDKYSDENIMKNMYNYQANQMQEEEVQNPQFERFPQAEENTELTKEVDSNENRYEEENNPNDLHKIEDDENKPYYNDSTNEIRKDKTPPRTSENTHKSNKNEDVEFSQPPKEYTEPNPQAETNINQNVEDDIIEEIMIEDDDFEKSNDKKAHSSNNNFTISQSGGHDGTVDSNALEEKYNYIEPIE